MSKNIVFCQDTTKIEKLEFFGKTVDKRYITQNIMDHIHLQYIAPLQQQIAELQQTVTRLSDQLQNPISCCSQDADDVPYHCKDIQSLGYRDSAIYSIFSPTLEGWIRVFCDMESDGGGWLVLQRRRDGSVAFDRSWNEYRDGFGSLSGEHWLGNQALHAITSHMPFTLRIDLEDWSGEKRYSLYSNFSISSESNNFQITFQSYIGGDAGDALGRNGKQNNSFFSTRDHDNDKMAEYNCAEHDNGFWYSDCAYGSLNGPYCFGGMPFGSIIWNTEGNTWHPLHYCYRATEMKIRPSI